MGLQFFRSDGVIDGTDVDAAGVGELAGGGLGGGLARAWCRGGGGGSVGRGTSGGGDGGRVVFLFFLRRRRSSFLGDVRGLSGVEGCSRGSGLLLFLSLVEREEE